MKIIAHRGLSGEYPENTLKAFRAALDVSSKFVELDVHFVAGELIVIHDDQLDRTTSGKGSIYTKSISELCELDAGHGEKIPLLSEVFDLLQGRAVVNIELKGESTAKPTVDFLKERISSGALSYKDFWLSSFLDAELLTARELDPEISLSALVGDNAELALNFAIKVGAGSVGIKHSRVSASFVETAHSMGLEVFVYTVNAKKQFEEMIRLNVDGVFSDYPQRFIGLVL